MRNYNADPGCIYDTLFFLSHFHAQLAGAGDEGGRITTPYYLDIEASAASQNIIIPLTLYPLVVRHQGKPSFLDYVLYEDRAFDECSLRQTEITLGNLSYLNRRFCEHFFPQHDVRRVKNSLGAYPDGLDMLKAYAFPPQMEFYIYYAAVHFDQVADDLKSAFLSIFAELAKSHTAFLSENTKFSAELNMGTIQMEKLKAISGQQDEKDFPFRFFLSLMEPELILPNSQKPAQFILGSSFDKVLDERYKYTGLTPYSLAIAIGNKPRYDIFRMLTKRFAMSRNELEKELRTSRSEIEYNLNVMRERGLVEVARRQGNTNYYKINPEFIRVTAGALLDDAKSMT